MTEVAVATVSQEAADAGAETAAEGGNAVDAAVCAALSAVVTHPGMCSIGGGAFITVWPPGGSPVTIDGGFEMPGRGLPPGEFGSGGRHVRFDYGNGVETTVGPGSVATPGLLAACSLAAERYGKLPWARLLRPAYRQARDGFPMPPSCHEFLSHAYEAIYAEDPRSRAALQGEAGGLAEPGETLRIPGLAETVRTIAEEGAAAFYEGELGRRVAEHVRQGGGVLTRRDLAAYRPAVRDPVEASLDGWQVATNPPPAVGGAAMAAMLKLMADGLEEGAWTARAVGRLARVQQAVLGHCRARLDASGELAEDVERLMRRAELGDLAGLKGSSSTIHVSAVDSAGTACSATVSDGYGSGVMPPETGIWLNNCLGEEELNRQGYHAREPGKRLPSNMAPSAARHRDGSLLAVGSPGAERIPTAVLQVLLNFIRLDRPLGAAVEGPRLHVDPGPDSARAACEPGLPVEAIGLPLRRFDGPSMFFGGVEAALWRPNGGFRTAADERRTGGTAVGESPES